MYPTFLRMPSFAAFVVIGLAVGTARGAQERRLVLLRGGKITLEAAEWLAEADGAMLIGGAQLSLELYKVGRPDMTCRCTTT